MMSKMVRLLLVIGIMGLCFYGCESDNSSPEGLPTAQTPTVTQTNATVADVTITTGGTPVQQQFTATQNGVLTTTDKTIAVPASAGASTAATITLPANVAAYTGAAGTTPVTGTVNIKALTYDAISIPPGVSYTPAADTTFVPLGLVDITATDATGANVPITRFNPAVPVKITIPPNTINPETMAAIKPGDVVAIYSSTDGVNWVAEPPPYPVVDANNQITYAISHLTKYMLGRRGCTSTGSPAVTVTGSTTGRITVSSSLLNVAHSFMINGQVFNTSSFSISLPAGTYTLLYIYQDATVTRCQGSKRMRIVVTQTQVPVTGSST